MKFLEKFYNMQNHSHQKTDNVHFARQRKKIIIFKPESATLNTRNELGAHCKHKQTKLLYKKPKKKDKT